MSPPATMLNQIANQWYFVVFHVTWQASLLAVVLLAVVLWGRRWPSGLRYSLLILALLKFALPPMLSVPTGLFSRIGTKVAAVPVVTDRPAVAIPNDAEPRWPVSVESPTFDILSHSPIQPQPTLTSASRPAPVSIDFRVWFMALHLLGTLGMACWIVWKSRSMTRAIRRGSDVVNGELKRRFEQLSDQLGLGRRPRLLLLDEQCGPMAYGVWRPVVVLPKAVLTLDAAALDVILAHELAHHRRRDPLMNWVQLALTATWWFNPVLWLLNRQVRRLREDCCDDLLLSRKITTGPAYCETLLTTATRLTPGANSVVALGFGERLHPLGKRFERIMDHTIRRAPHLSLAGIFFVSLLAVVVLPGLRTTDGDEPKQAARDLNPAVSKSDEAEVASKDPPRAKPEGAQVVPAAKGNPLNDEAQPQASEKPAAAKVEVHKVWLEGSTVKGRVVDHVGAPVVDAEVLILGDERICVNADRRNWFVLDQGNLNPDSTRTDKNGEFVIRRKQGDADRLAVIHLDPLFWVVTRDTLENGDNVRIQLPESGSLRVQCDLPGKPEKMPVMIDLKTFDETVWNRDFLRFHFASSTLNNPGETIFERMPPAHYVIQPHHETKTGPRSTSLTGAERRTVKIESGKRSTMDFDRKIGKPLSGQVTGLQYVELRYAYLNISYFGQEEVLDQAGKRGSFLVAFDVIPIGSDGRFTTDPIPPGKYQASIFAVRASTPNLSSQSSDFLGGLEFTVLQGDDQSRIEIPVTAGPLRDLSQLKDLRVRVVDEQGTPLPKFQVQTHTADHGWNHWSEGRNGLEFLGDENRFRGAPLLLLIRANGYASMMANFAGPQREQLSKGEAVVTFRRGQKVELQFHLPKSMTWPKGTIPEAYYHEMESRVRMMRQPANRRADVVTDFNMLNLSEIGGGRFEFLLAEDTPPFHVAIHAPGFLQCFEVGPFTLNDVKDGTLHVDVPPPATLEVALSTGNYPVTDLPFKSAEIDVNWQLQGDSMLGVASTSDAPLTTRLKLTDLAPGNYYVTVGTQPKEGSNNGTPGEINVGRFFDRRKLEIKAGAKEKIEFHWSPFDPNAIQGTRTAVVRILTADGKPAIGRSASVTYFDGHYGAQTAFAGAVPESGEILLTGITDKVPALVEKDAAYMVRVDDRRVGSFGLTSEPDTQQFDFTLTPMPGDMAPDIQLTNLASGQATRLSDFRGKVVFLEFWATWCGPCQEPMAKLNKLAGEQSAAWKDRAVIVPVGVDAQSSKITQHIQERGWTNLDHFSTGENLGGDFESAVAKAYVLDRVPEALLISPEGRILWRGHPQGNSNVDGVKAKIEEALK